MPLRPIGRDDDSNDADHVRNDDRDDDVDVNDCNGSDVSKRIRYPHFGREQVLQGLHGHQNS